MKQEKKIFLIFMPFTQSDILARFKVFHLTYSEKGSIHSLFAKAKSCFGKYNVGLVDARIHVAPLFHMLYKVASETIYEKR